ncbi:MAG: peptidoglycan DD-metalloendopeptidase family protein [Alphaproteobacteria bacterium]|nr:peptidoglycan DD-metalloendopeptidase family protein [Alphaproteobacteria bacterium]MBV9418806.1 peptidoglycan DD-metalloendopeptidase family protein [Alphaproteobacteria bacterium]
MNRRIASTHPLMHDLQRRARAASAALATTDGRWAVVSTSITALVAGSMAWLAVSAMPPLHAKATEASTNFLPYKLFTQLMSAGSNLISTSPSTTAPHVPPPAQLDRPLAEEEAGDTTPGVETRTVTLEKGDTLSEVLENAGVTGDDAQAVINALVKVFEVRTLRYGKTFTLTFEPAPKKVEPMPVVHYGAPPAGTLPAPAINNLADASDADSGDAGDVAPADEEPVGRLLSVSFSPSVEHDITITRNADNSFTANDAVKEVVMHTHRAGAVLDGSLYLAGVQAGIPAGVLVDMIKLFGYKVDFQRDLRPGDSFEVYYSFYYTTDGQPVREGNIDYAMIKTGGKEIALYRYQPDEDQPAEYYDAKGASLKGMLMKTPVDGARISSGFGMRFHPVLGYSRMHKGIDFAVPVGTPVMAAGSGTVKIAGRASGYGNFVKIDMGNGWGTGYGHLSRFAPGVRPGAHVRQGQIIAYSGNTGLSTGPHLHYEIFQNGTQVNPLKVKVAQGSILSGKSLRDFLVERLHIDAVLAGMPLEFKVADVATDLRSAKAR